MRTPLVLSGLLAVSTLYAATPPVRSRAGEFTVSLRPSQPSPAPLGTLVTWTAVASDQAPDLWYRFGVRPPGGEYQTLRDYGPDNSLTWTAGDREGLYEMEVSVRDRNTGEIASAGVLYQMESRLTGDFPVLTPTANSLVFLYSAPPCSGGGRMRVQFRAADAAPQFTSPKSCRTDASMNFYLAGLRPTTTYTVRHVIDSDSGLLTGPPLTLTTPAAPVSLAQYRVLQPPAAPITDGVLLQSTLFLKTVATDLWGNLVWYYPGDISFLTQPEPGGLFLGIRQNPGADASGQIVREFDLAGVATRETNAARVSEQLAALGLHPISAFHHDARPLPGGGLLVLASTERLLTDVQGPGPVDVVGDMILALDRNLQVVWAWDSFDHLDPHRMATLGETCPQAGCPPLYLARQGNDWLHGNSLQLTPDGNILYSARHQDWVIKIDYNRGRGSGQILWRLGKDGDFQISSADPYPWFSHQHDPSFLRGDNTTLLLFDNGNTRQAGDPAARSRGQVLQLDETNRVARMVLNADLGAYSFALGAAEKLPNGNYHFDSGWLDGNVAQSLEVDAAGSIVYAIEVDTPQYRTFRMRDLYTP